MKAENERLTEEEKKKLLACFAKIYPDLEKLKKAKILAEAKEKRKKHGR